MNYKICEGMTSTLRALASQIPEEEIVIVINNNDGLVFSIINDFNPESSSLLPPLRHKHLKGKSRMF